jgi:transposase, IS6 family
MEQTDLQEVLQLCRSALISWADMLLAPSVAGLFKWRQFEPEMILLAVGWYLRFSLSYRDVEELLAERGLLVDHVTVWRWVQRYAPEIQRRLRPRLRPTNDSWRVDETYIRVKGKWVDLYRAVDSSGATIDFLLSAKRDAAAAERFLAKALGGESHPAPRVINTDEHAGYPPAIVRLKADEALKENCRHRPVQYLNNVLGSPGHQTPGARKPTFSFILGSLAYDRRLPDDSYDPQRPSVLECGGCEGRSTAPLHSRSVLCDELDFRSSTPTFGSTTKLQHIQTVHDLTEIDTRAWHAPIKSR